MLDGKRKFEYDGWIFILKTLNTALFKPDKITGNINPYSEETAVVLSKEQREAKEKNDMRRGMKLMARYLVGFVKKRK